jgi:RimJ/RimL family protein N-acetyltransferase
MNPILLSVPEELQTARLRLRTPRPGDGEVVFPSVQGSLAELKAWMPWATDDYSQQSAEEWCRKSAAEFITRVQLQYCLFTLDGHHAGNVGAFRFDWNVPSCEIGYWLRTDLVGQGLMSEAVNALVAMLVRDLKMVRLEIRCDDRNVRSARVAERCGFQLEGVTRCVERLKDGTLRDRRTYARIENPS